jgi:radical SAM superfamily enzyme YgiQ (UPF0313 family)
MSGEVHPPLGLCVLAAHLGEAGHKVSILDLDLEEKAGGSGGQNHYIEKLRGTLHEQQPRAVGVTSMFNNSLHAERLIQATKEFDPGITTVAGGSHFGALPLQSLQRIPELDFVIRGEGEVALSQLLKAIDNAEDPWKIPGLCYRSPDGVVENRAGPLLDLGLSTPTWTGLGAALDVRKYVATIPGGSPRKTVYVEAGRGCPFACSFCATAPFWQRRYRVKAIDCIIAEMRYLYEEHQYDTFMLVHDLLTADKRFMSDFCDALFASRLPVEWTANHRADIELGDLAPRMRSAGCLSVFMGIESASEHIQKEVQKGLTREQVFSTVNSLRDVGISSTCSFIVGFPSETDEDVSATLTLAGRLKMIGAEPVQVHRLRRWPPAPLAALSLRSSFDLEALRLEYPSDEVPEKDVETIKADPAFFMGYFTPDTLAGSALQVAQLELLFANMLAVFPVTAALLGAIHGNRLVSAYYRALAVQGPISRADLDNAIGVRDTLVPYLAAWVTNDSELGEWQRTLLNGALSYERDRVGFMAGASDKSENEVVKGNSWTVFKTAVDVVELLRRLAAGSELTVELGRDGYVAMTRGAEGAVRGFGLDMKALARLQQGDRELLEVLENQTL